MQVPSLVENLGEKAFRAFVLGVLEKVFRRADLDDAALVHKHDPVGDAPGKAHLMG